MASAQRLTAMQERACATLYAAAVLLFKCSWQALGRAYNESRVVR